MSGSILNQVRQSAQQVIQQARLVRLNQERLASFAASLDPVDVRVRYYYAEDFHFQGTGRELLDYVITVDALNFGSGFSPQWEAQRQGKSTYKSVASTLKTYLEEGNPLHANFATSVTVEKLAALFKVNPDFPLMTMFADSLNSLGQFVLQEYDGEYANLLDSLPGPNLAAQLVALLTQHLPSFNDLTLYHSQPIYFYKRAQILVNDLYLAFNGVGFGDFPDISHLTAFADNLIPHLFRVEGILEYDTELTERIEKGLLLAAGSPEEIEIRAAGVFCVEEICRLVSERGGTDDYIFPAQLDVYLWNRAQDLRYKPRPRHLTITYFY